MPLFNLGKILPIAAVIGGIIWGASGFYTIKEAERGVTLRFWRVSFYRSTWFKLEANLY